MKPRPIEYTDSREAFKALLMMDELSLKRIALKYSAHIAALERELKRVNKRCENLIAHEQERCHATRPD